MDKAEDLKKLKADLIAKVGEDKKVCGLQLTAADHLSNKVQTVTMSFLQGGKLLEQEFTDGKLDSAKELASVYQTDSWLKNKQGSIGLKDLDFEKIAAHYAEAIKMIPEGYSGQSMNNYSFIADNKNNLQTEFLIEGTKNGEAKKTTRSTITTNYYEFKFKNGNDGKLALLEE